MWQLAHLASGAFVGQQVSVPVIAFGFGVATHLIIDEIPHYWPWPMKERHWFSVVDYIITLPVFYFLLQNYHFNQEGLFWGAVGSLAVDIVLVGIPFIYHSPIGRWHKKRQPHHRQAVYILTDVAVIVLCLFLLQK